MRVNSEALSSPLQLAFNDMPLTNDCIVPYLGARQEKLKTYHKEAIMWSQLGVIKRPSEV